MLTEVLVQASSTKVCRVIVREADNLGVGRTLGFR